MENAPFFAEIAEGPAGGSAHWLTTADNLRIRVGLWNRQAEKGTVLLFPGRTEYIEKYGRTAADLAARGYATFAIDWRGQGIADRMLADRRVGHVARFPDYQHDVAAMVTAARELNLPAPFYLLAHSMGGCIGLRAVMEGLPVAACAFTGPMWGIRLAPTTRPAAWVLSISSAWFGFGHFFAPGTKPEGYVTVQPFDDNQLTTDTDMYAYMQRQLQANPDLGLGGPSLNWLREALIETRTLAQRPSPALPCLTFLGTNERIVDIPRIRDRMARWPQGQLEMVETGEHEVLMEKPEMRAQVFDQLDRFYSDAATGALAPAARSA